MRTQGRAARLVLLAALLLGLGLSQATAHFCVESAPVSCVHPVAGHDAAEAAPGDDAVVLCLAAMGALAVAVILLLFGGSAALTALARPAERPVRLPPTRGAPPFALSVRRVAVLRI